MDDAVTLERGAVVDLQGFKLRMGEVAITGSGDVPVFTDTSGTPGELRVTAESDFSSGDYKIQGFLSFIKDGPGKFTWSHALASSIAATVPITITNGIFKIGATTGNLFGAGGTVTVKAPGQFDINNSQQSGAVRARTFYIEGDGQNGSGAIVNSSGSATAGNHLNKIVLTGDATIGGTATVSHFDTFTGTLRLKDGALSSGTSLAGFAGTAVIDVAERDAALDVDGKNWFTFDSMKEVFVDVGSRKLQYGDTLLSWETAPSNVRFKLQGEYKGILRKGNDGLVYARNPGMMIFIQ